MTMARDRNPLDLKLAATAEHRAGKAGVSEAMRGAGTFAIRDPLGEVIHIPAADDEDYTYFSLRDVAAIRQYYDENGYVVIRGLIPGGLCDQALTDFEREVKPFPGHIYRQTTANPERHALTDWGLMLNPILNVQSLDTRSFSRFKEAGLAILTHPRTQEAVRTILGEPGKIVQSMYFDGNPATWPHQDTYYLDAEELGRMTAAWFAVVDIEPGAGRFFIYPKSHRIDMAKNGGDFDIAFNHARYKNLVVDIIHNHRLECRAPALRQGDVLFWSAKTIHGSLETTQPRFSRSSFTAHYIPSSARFLQYQTRIRRLNCLAVNGMQVHRPKDLARRSQRSIFWIETHYPRTFQTVKKLAIKAVTR
jgi:phytanoyl-CoA hydroxylase